MMSHDYKELFKDRPEFSRVKDFSSRVIELSQYLDEVLNVNYEDKGEPIKVTWHSNCHALRVQKSIQASKNLIRKLKNVELVELQYEEECCGFGGTFSVKEPEISNAMVRNKIKDIQNTGVKYLISGDGGCLLNIDGTMRRMGLDVKGIHLYEFLFKRLEGEIMSQNSHEEIVHIKLNDIQMRENLMTAMHTLQKIDLGSLMQDLGIGKD